MNGTLINTSKLNRKLLPFTKKEVTFRIFNNERLKSKTSEVIFTYILNNYDFKLQVYKNERILIFNRKDIDQDLMDLLHNLTNGN